MQPGLTAGLRCLGVGIRMLPKRRVRAFVAVPLFINTALFVGVLAGGAGWIDASFDRLLPDWLAFLEWLIWPLLAIAALVLVFFSFTLIANLIGAPFNGLLAEAVAAHLGAKGTDAPADWRRLARESVAALASEVGKLIYFGLRALPLLVLFVIPGVQLLAPFVWFLFGAWALALEYGDYPLGNQGLAFREQRLLLRRHRRLALGFGAGVMFMTSVPGLNFIAMPAAVAGATVLWHRHLRDASPGDGGP